MKQILAIFRKDARHLWPEIIASLAMLTALVFIYPESWLTGDTLFHRSPFLYTPFGSRFGFGVDWLIVLVPITWWILMARLIHVERLVGNTQFWVTRPYEWPKLLAAKLLFIAVFIFIPFFLAQCALLAEAGFYPLLYIHGLVYNLFVTAVVLVLPVAALAAVTSGFGRLVLVALGVILYVAAIVALYTQLPFELKSAPSGPVSDGLSFIFLACGCCAVIIAQYATRKARIGWALLIAVCLLLTALAIVNPDRWLMNHRYPVQASNASAPIEFVQSKDFAGSFASQGESEDAIHISMVAEAQGFGTQGGGEGLVIRPAAMKATIDAPGGAHWESPWQSMYSQNLMAGSPDTVIGFSLRRAIYDQFKSAPVTLHLFIAVDEARVSGVTRIPLQVSDSAISGVGICTPRTAFRGFQNLDMIQTIYCRSAMRLAHLTYVSGYLTQGDCAVGSASDSMIGSAWIGSLDNDPAELGITSVWMNPIFLSNMMNPVRRSSGSEMPHPGERIRPRHLCPGSQVTYTTYEPAAHLQVQMTVDNFKLPELAKGPYSAFVTVE
jgi:hypothetical protein